MRRAESPSSHNRTQIHSLTHVLLAQTFAHSFAVPRCGGPGEPVRLAPNLRPRPGSGGVQREGPLRAREEAEVGAVGGRAGAE